MRKHEITLGATYAVNVSGQIVPVRITGPAVYGGWHGENRITGREVRIHSPQRCRYEMEQNASGNWVRALPQHAEETLRVEGKDNAWVVFECRVERREGACVEVFVPRLSGRWLLGRDGMVANVGGNDWAIYTIHPDDCARLCGVATQEAPHA